MSAVIILMRRENNTAKFVRRFGSPKYASLSRWKRVCSRLTIVRGDRLVEDRFLERVRQDG